MESFLSWKEKFDEEMGHTKRKELAEREGKKLTGRELFMTDKTLDQSDLKFLDDGNRLCFISCASSHTQAVIFTLQN